MPTPDVAEVSKLREIIKLQQSLQEAVHRLTEDIERRDTLREIRASFGWQLWFAGGGFIDVK